MTRLGDRGRIAIWPLLFQCARRVDAYERCPQTLTGYTSSLSNRWSRFGDIETIVRCTTWSRMDCVNTRRRLVKTSAQALEYDLPCISAAEGHA